MNIRFRKLIASLVFLGLAGAFHAEAATPVHPLAVRAFRTSSSLSLIPRTPPLPDTLRVLAIRVDFQPDTISQTTGDGSFFYDIPEGEDPADWKVDPPPHDSLYFADQLYALRRYYLKNSRGKLTLTGRVNSGSNSGGDIFPSGARNAYTMYYPIWHINWGNDDQERLNQTLTQLFIDAWTLADADPEVNLSDYDIFLIFHAGAGNEFDTGADTTPFDIPSVTIGPKDLTDYGDLPGSLALNSGTITWGAILPETQRQDDIEVGLLGTVVHQVGFLLGMPHLYDTSTGDPGVGMFGVMDRGFGGFFGLIPTPPNAWTRAYMGWDSVTTIPEGDVELGSLNLPDSVCHGGLDRLVKVPINEQEYYLLEARHRDPEEDSLTYGYDREGHRATFNNDYSIDFEDGFGVLVDVEDPDFDLPASGVLVWHIDQSVIDQKLAKDQLQTDRNRRAVDLEEMDGSEDIGNSYEFLTPSYNTEYGIAEDAFYAGNDLWQEANTPGPVEFGPFTIPSTLANTGGESHITLTHVSAIRDTMTLTVVNSWDQGAFPKTLDWADGNVDLTFADLDRNDSLELILWDETGRVVAYRADGSLYKPDTLLFDLQNSNVVIRTFPNSSALYLIGQTIAATVADGGPGNPVGMGVSSMAHGDFVSAAIAGSGWVAVVKDSSETPLLFRDNIGPSFIARTDTLESRGELVRLGTEGADSLALVLENGKLYLLSSVSSELSEANAVYPPAGVTDCHPVHPVVADVDGDGIVDVAAPCTGGELAVWLGSEAWSVMHVEQPEQSSSTLLPGDIDGDGLPELNGILSEHRLVALEPNGLISEGTPVTLSTENGLPHPDEGRLIDMYGLGELDLIVPSFIEPGKMAIAGYNLADGRSISGYPLDFGYASGQSSPALGIADLDGDGDLELVTVTRGVNLPELHVFDLPARANSTARVYWGLASGDAQGGRVYPFATQGTTTHTSRSLAQAYVWPNPILDNLAHVRFFGEASGRATLRIYDLVGRLVSETASSVSEGIDNEISVNVSDWPSGVYVARLETGGSHTLIRFAVVH